MRRHEQSVIDAFNQFLGEKARTKGSSFHSFSLDGQDRIAGADYLLSNGTRFSLIEFKYEEADIHAEAKKPRRLNLCLKLERDDDMRALHDKAHFLCWKDKRSKHLKLNIFRHEACNKTIFTSSSAADLTSEAPDDSRRVLVSAFAEQFLLKSADVSLCIDKFERYLQWLLQGPSEGRNSSLELLALNPDQDECAVLMFRSVRAAHKWLQGRPPSREASEPPD
jgi:hypothetical protein